MDHHDTHSGEGMLIAHQMGRLHRRLHNCSTQSKRERKGGGRKKKKKQEPGKRRRWGLGGGWFCRSDYCDPSSFLSVFIILFTPSPLLSATRLPVPVVHEDHAVSIEVWRRVWLWKAALNAKHESHNLLKGKKKPWYIFYSRSEKVPFFFPRLSVFGDARLHFLIHLISAQFAFPLKEYFTKKFKFAAHT